jgi:predicted transcriptional regulator
MLRAAVPVVLVALGACAHSMSRDDIRVGYRKGLERAGVKVAQATCLTDKFFASLSDDELRAFQKRDRLTAEETARFGKLADQCADPNATAP